jgi:hypothetical protein
MALFDSIKLNINKKEEIISDEELNNMVSSFIKELEVLAVMNIKDVELLNDKLANELERAREESNRIRTTKTINDLHVVSSKRFACAAFLRKYYFINGGVEHD